MNCIQCGKKHTAFDDDAGTYRQYFCSTECEALVESELSLQVVCPNCQSTFDASVTGENFWWGNDRCTENLECPHCGASTRFQSEYDPRSGYSYSQFKEVQS